MRSIVSVATKRIATVALACAVLVSCVSGVAFAQGPGGPGGPGGGPFAAMRAWNQAHPNVGQVGRTIRGLSDLETSPQKLNAKQAHKILAILMAWKSKPIMTDPQALKVNTMLLSYLTPAQKTAVTARHPFGGGPGGPGGRPGGFGGGPGGPGGRPGGFGGGPGGPGGRPGGFGGGPGGPGGFKMPAPKDYNPLNPASMPFPPMRTRAQGRMDGLIAALKATK